MDNPQPTADLLVQLAQARSEEASAATELKKLKADPNLLKWEKTKRDATTRVTALTTQVREYFLGVFRAKQALPEKIATRNSVVYKYDSAKAVEWAEKNMPILVTKVVDCATLETNFDNLKKQGKLPDFVAVEEVTSITIASDLSSLLKQPEPAPAPEQDITF